ncbi:MAG: DUF1559 domain-containing protein, partial [Planctomycetales bacterium]|nr:DUF1559 domain-containing protein [Planctomycetales bacterium]
SSPENTTWAQASYSGSMGSQGCPSANGSCNIFYTNIPLTATTPGVYYQELLSGGNADHGNTYDQSQLSGVFGRWGISGNLKFGDVRDGLSNTIFVGEVLPECSDHNSGWWNTNGQGSAHASTSCPINIFTVCVASQAEAVQKGYPYNGLTSGATDCTPKNNWNLSFAFKSRHPQGCQFAFGDGSVHFISQSVNYATYQRLGGRRDGLPIGDY